MALRIPTITRWILCGALVAQAKPAKNQEAPPRARILVRDSSATAKAVLRDLGGQASWELYRDRDGSDRWAWVLDPEDLVWMRARTAPETGLLRSWDLSEVAPPSRDRDPDRKPTLNPVLYPVGRGRWAIALLTRKSAMYSGGWGNWTFADFHVLAGADDTTESDSGGLDSLHAGIPFSCNKACRACFSEEEYKKAGNCHEEWTGILRLGYSRDADGDVRWKAVWDETHVPGGVTRERSTRSRVPLDLEHPPTTFCDGPDD